MGTNDSVTDVTNMEMALSLAREALDAGEFPVGCVIAAGGQVVARGRRMNSMGEQVNEIDHAEIVALRSLPGAEALPTDVEVSLYSTLEPCLMCFGAILLSRVDRIVYAYEDVMGGGTRCDRSSLTPLYKDRRIAVVGSVMRKESLALFQTFFSNPANDYWQGSPLASYTLSRA
jgi:tRNA(adenine34) deaminase